jgi:parallel beta-helix repeat protein
VTASGLYSSQTLRRVIGAVIVAGILVAAGAFLVDAGDAQPDPVAFSQATTLGLPDEEQNAIEHRGLSMPKVEIFYSQYSYVVGYEGVERAIDTLQAPEHTQQFGDPLVVYVSDYAGTNVELTEEGYLDAASEPAWVSADDAWFVVGSEAQTAVGETVVPFSDRDDADAFADDYGGDVVDWSTARTHDVELEDAGVVRENIPELYDYADTRTREVSSLLEREVSVVVGDDAPTIQAGVNAAPPDTTVLVPAGTYDENVTVDRPVTIRGESATVRGNGTGSVIDIRHENVAIAGLNITGVGEQHQSDSAKERGEWDDLIDVAYGHSDAGIRVTNASNVYVRDVNIETPASGVLYRDSPDGVVDNLRVKGPEQPFDGFMGVLSIRSPVVVQNSTFVDGRDGIYLHRAHGTVVRNNTFLENRFGVHFMYTSDSLIADNVARRQTSAGITIMTGPARNAVVGNDIRNATDGIIPGGSRSYIANNVVAHNDRGIITGTSQSVYEHNVVYGNDIGMRSGSTFPSNVVRENDFVANVDHAKAGVGPLRIWTDDGTGNYWSGARGAEAGSALPQSYSPTDPIESQFHRTDGTRTLAASPAARALAEIRATSPGLRRGNIVDTAPLADPISPEIVQALRDGETVPVWSVDGDSDDD